LLKNEVYLERRNEPALRVVKKKRKGEDIKKQRKRSRIF